jgi:hypothetical protein
MSDVLVIDDHIDSGNARLPIRSRATSFIRMA